MSHVNWTMSQLDLLGGEAPIDPPVDRRREAEAAFLAGLLGQWMTGNADKVKKLQRAALEEIGRRAVDDARMVFATSPPKE